MRPPALIPFSHEPMSRLKAGHETIANWFKLHNCFRGVSVSESCFRQSVAFPISLWVTMTAILGEPVVNGLLESECHRRSAPGLLAHLR